MINYGVIVLSGLDNGKLSTYIIGLIVVIYGFLISNPDLIRGFLEKAGLGGWAPLIISILAFTYDYAFPRNTPTGDEEGDGGEA